MGYSSSADLSFELPLSSDRLFFLSRGAQSAGHVRVSTAPSDSDKVTVDVLLRYHGRDDFRFAGVCLLERGKNEHGLGFFTPDRWGRWWGRHVFFDVTVRLPTKNASPLVINALSTDLSNFAIDVEELQDFVEFRTLDVRTSNAPFTARSLYADNAKITTSNGPVRGAFNTSTTLSLTTSNGGVRAQISLSNDNKHSTDLDIHTSNGPIESSISLFSKSKSSTGGNFHLTTKTSNNALILKLPVSPLNATVQLTGATSNGPGRIELPATYEGAFALATSGYMSTNLELAEGVEDPSGEKRHREVRQGLHNRGVLEGSVNWIPAGDGAESSWARVRTSNAPASIRL